MKLKLSCEGGDIDRSFKTELLSIGIELDENDELEVKTLEELEELIAKLEVPFWTLEIGSKKQGLVLTIHLIYGVPTV